MPDSIFEEVSPDMDPVWTYSLLGYSLNFDPYLPQKAITGFLEIPQDGLYNIDFSGGVGIYMIQKLANCNNLAPEDIFPLYSGQEFVTNEAVCVHPCNELYMEGFAANQHSFPEEYITGGMTIENVQNLQLLSGRYQVTLWGGPGYQDGPIEKPHISITNNMPIIVEGHWDYHTKDALGFRIRAIKDFTEPGKLSTTKTYLYQNDIQNPLNSSAKELSSPPVPHYYYGKYVYCITNMNETPEVGLLPTITMTSAGISNSPHIGYESVFELQTDQDGNSDGYIRHNFTAGLSGVIYSEDMTKFSPDYKNGKPSEKSFFDNAGNLKYKEIYAYDQLPFFSESSIGFRRNPESQYAWSQSPNWALYYDYGEVSAGLGQTAQPGVAQCPQNFFNKPWYNCDLGKYSYHRVDQQILGAFGFLASKETTIFDPGGMGITKTETYEYSHDEPFKLAKKNVSSSTGVKSEEYIYDNYFHYNPEKITYILSSENGQTVSQRNNGYTFFRTIQA